MSITKTQNCLYNMQDSDNESVDGFVDNISSSWNATALLKTLNYSFENSLTESSPRSLQPPEILVPLKPHQLALIAAMKERENASFNGLTQNNLTTYTNYGILGDTVGSGKSLVILSHIAQLRKEKHNTYSRRILHPLSIPNFFTVMNRQYSDTSGNNLIVVPHTLFRQWTNYIKTQTTLNIFQVKSVAVLQKDVSGIRAEIANSDATLISNTLYSDLMRLCKEKNIHWRRVFWDEADSIHITSTSYRPAGCFNWFVTATWSNFILEGHVIRPYLLGILQEQPSNYHPDFIKWMKQEIGLEYVTTSSPYGNNLGRIVYLRVRSGNFFKAFRSNYSLRGITVLRTADAFMDISRTMPQIIDTQILCKGSAISKAITGIVSNEIQSMLHAGDIEGALEQLGVPADTPMSLLEAVNSHRAKELDRLKKTLAFKETIDYATPQAKETALATIRSKIESLEEQSKTLKERLEGIKDEVCPICYEEPKAITLTPCCSHIFCGSCVLASLSRNPSCPLCRTALSPGQLTRLTDESEKKKNKKNKVDQKKEKVLLSKNKQLLKILQDNPSAKILVFSRYENPFSTLSMECLEAGIDYTILKGNKDCIANTIKQFETGEKRVLFLPTQTAAAGMNLVAASHVVLLHAMTPEEEKQVVGRAYRLGRTEPLNVIRLLHENEQI